MIPLQYPLTFYLYGMLKSIIVSADADHLNIRWPKSQLKFIGPKRKYPPLPRPSRCINLGRLVKRATGCNSGARCTFNCELHDCNTIPVEMCQYCADYEPEYDPKGGVK